MTNTLRQAITEALPCKGRVTCGDLSDEKVEGEEPFKAFRILLDDHDSDDEAVAGSIVAILLTRHETVRRKRAAETNVTRLTTELDAIKASVERDQHHDLVRLYVKGCQKQGRQQVELSRLRKIARNVAIRGLQTDAYQTDFNFAQDVDTALAATTPKPPTSEGGGEGE